MKRLRSIRTKSILYTFLIMVVPIIILGAAGTLYYQGVIKQNIQNDLLENARAVAALTANYMDRAVMYIDAQSDNARLINAIRQNDTVTLDDQVQRIAGGSNLYYWVFVTDPAGNILASYPYSSVSGSNINDTENHIEPLGKGKAFISNPRSSKVSGRPTVFVGTPVVSNGSTTGLLVGALDEYQYYDIIGRTKASVPDEFIFIVNQTGHVITSDSREAMNSIADLSAVPVVHYVLAGKEGTLEYRYPANGSLWLCAYAPVPGYGWGTIVGIAADVAYKPIKDATGMLIAALLLLTLLTGGLAYFVGSYIAGPITRMSEAAKEVGEGVDLSKYLPYDRDDELGGLANAFQEMSDRIIAARKKIKGEKKHSDLYIDVMGHDINNLNQVILSDLEMIEQYDHINERQLEFIRGAIAATKDSANIIKNVKAIQAVSAEKLDTDKVDLNDFILECIKEAPRPENKKVDIRYTPRKGLIVEAVPQLKLAFCNVIGNSIKYSGGEVRTDINVSETTTDGRKYYVLEIADNGIGIPDEVKKTLFSRFQNDSREPPGKGLGLYAAKVLAERFGGSLMVGSRMPEDYLKGTKVIIRMPAADSDIVAEESKNAGE